MELDAGLVERFQAEIDSHGLADRVTAVHGDIRDTAAADATVAVCFLLPDAIAVVRDSLIAVLRRGGRVVCAYWGIPGLVPAAKETHGEMHNETLLLYTQESLPAEGGDGDGD